MALRCYLCLRFLSLKHKSRTTGWRRHAPLTNNRNAGSCSSWYTFRALLLSYKYLQWKEHLRGENDGLLCEKYLRSFLHGGITAYGKIHGPMITLMNFDKCIPSSTAPNKARSISNAQRCPSAPSREPTLPSLQRNRFLISLICFPHTYTLHN